MDIAISFCPNDTFLFHAWIKQYVGKNLPPEVRFGDIENLNHWAKEKKYPLIKVSFGVFPEIIDDYELLPCGSALGFNCGPKLIAKKHFSLDDVKNKTVAIPGEHTTAHLLLNRLLGGVKKKRFCLYHEIYSFLSEGFADAGLIIHESRFTFEKHGFQEIADLGTLWQEHFSLPIPLGGIAIRRNLSTTLKREVLATLKSSLEFARENPSLSQSFILEHAQEKETEVIEAHIQTYVNEETSQLSETGISAIKTLISLDPSKWLFKKHDR